MHIYFSGILGAGLAPLAQLCLDCGYEVSGSDACESLNLAELKKRGVNPYIGKDAVNIEKVHKDKKIDWFVRSSAIKEDHPEMFFVAKNGIKNSKRDGMINEILKHKNLKMIAIAGTHGKTTTTAMFVWLFKQLKTPVSYSIGSNISFGPAAEYEQDSQYFVYEADEFDRNMLNFYPEITVIPSLDYDHQDTYPTIEDYRASFLEFINRSNSLAVGWHKDLDVLEGLDVAKTEIFDNTKEDLSDFKLIGKANRENAFLVAKAAMKVFPEVEFKKLVEVLSSFPGTQRRLEKLAENIYSDYAHHPSEIKTVLQNASEVSDNVVMVYQPHQNVRQHTLLGQYTDCFKLAKKVYWLPTYLSREDPSLEILKPENLFKTAVNKDSIEAAEMNEYLVSKLVEDYKSGAMILFTGAGSVDDFARYNLNSFKK